jgi:uncharacterized protein (DUF2147 family)
MLQLFIIMEFLKGDQSVNRFFKIALTSLLFTVLQMIAIASYAASPMGYWKTIDDVTGRPKGIVKISGSANDLTGTVVKLFPGALTVCNACEGSLRGKPTLGMTVMYGMQQNTDDPNVWSGGSILDPKSGRVYRCKITVSRDGKTLEVRGYIGFSLLGRSQTWIRERGE